MNLVRLLFLSLLAVGFVACKREAVIEPPQPVPVSDALSGIPTNAQPRLQTIKLFVGPAQLTAEVAATMEQTRAGLMFRTNMLEDEGMLFVFPYPHQSGFWMKNTKIPLSVAYIDPNGVIQEIHKLEPYNTNSVPAASDNIQFALEVNEGWFHRNNVEPGALIKTEKGSLQETFFRSR